VPQPILVVSLVALCTGSALLAQERPNTPSTAEARDTNLQAYVELLRTDIRGQKVAILTQLMDLQDAEDAKFWPVYRQYELELARLNDERVALIKEYSSAYTNISESTADRLITQALSLDERRSTLLKRYYAAMKEAVGSKVAAQFVQIEHQLLTIIDLQIASALPIVK
jgi:hypothetical protein